MDFQSSSGKQSNNYGYSQNRGQGNRNYSNNNNNNRDGNNSRDGSNYNNNYNRGGNYQKRNYNNNNNEKSHERGSRPGEARPKREAILDLAKYLDKRIKVNCLSRREVYGILRGYDQLMNLVLDDTTDVFYKNEIEIPGKEFEKQTRNLGRVILRSNLLYEISPADGIEEIDNPFIVTKSAADLENEQKEA